MLTRSRSKSSRSSRFQHAKRRQLHTELLEQRMMLAVTPIAPEGFLDLDGVTELRTAIDNNGNVLVLGLFEGTVDFDPGTASHTLTSSLGDDLFLARYSPSMALLDAVDLGDIELKTVNVTNPPTLAVDANNAVYVTGTYEGNNSCLGLSVISAGCDGPGEFLLTNERLSGHAMFVAKIDSSLQSYAWVNYATLGRNPGNSGGKVTSTAIAVDAGGNSVYVVGSLRGKGQIGGQNIQVGETGFVSKLDGNSGDFEWTNVDLQDFGFGSRSSVSLDDSDTNAVYIAQSSYLGRLDQLGNLIWERGDIEALGNIIAAAGSVYVGNSHSELVRKFDGASGNLIWTSGASGAIARGLAVSGDDLFVTGAFGDTAGLGTQVLATRGQGDGFVSQMDATSGEFIQSWRLGGESRDSASTMDAITAAAGSVYAVGTFEPNSADFPTGDLPVDGGETRGYLLKFGPTNDPTQPSITGFVADVEAIQQGDPLFLGIAEIGIASGLYDPASRVNSLSFYLDTNANRQVDPADTLLGTDTNGGDGWQVVASTAAIPTGTQRFLAQASYDVGSVTNAGIATVEVVGPSMNNRAYAQSETTQQGFITSGTYLDTHTSDDVYEVIEEHKYSGISVMDHEWTFDLSSTLFTSFSLEAHHNSRQDDFVFTCECGTGGRIELLVTKRADDDMAQTLSFPAGVTGIVTVRVEDLDIINAKRGQIFVDEMYFEAGSAAATSPTVPLTSDDLAGDLSIGRSSNASRKLFGEVIFDKTNENRSTSHSIVTTQPSIADNSARSSIHMKAGRVHATAIDDLMASVDDDLRRESELQALFPPW